MQAIVRSDVMLNASQVIVAHERVGDRVLRRLPVTRHLDQRPRHVERRVLVGVAEDVEHVLHRQLALGLDRERVVLGVGIELERRRQPAEGAPFAAPAAEAAARAVGGAELERLAARLAPQAEVLRQRVARWPTRGNAPCRRVPACGCAARWRTRPRGRPGSGPPPTRRPCAPCRAEDLEEPGLVRVGERERLAVVVVAVLPGQLVGDPDCLARGLRPLEHEPVQLRAVDDPVVALHSRLPPNVVSPIASWCSFMIGYAALR